MAMHHEKIRDDQPNQPMVKIYGTRGSAACYAIRDFLQRSDVPFQWIDLTSGDQASAEAEVRDPNDPSLRRTPPIQQAVFLTMPLREL
jgi:hypothetical protein